jgi:hypothetical protein
MPPKTPSELKEQAKRQKQKNPPARGNSRTADGMEVPNPTRSDFFGNFPAAGSSNTARSAKAVAIT